MLVGSSLQCGNVDLGLICIGFEFGGIQNRTKQNLHDGPSDISPSVGFLTGDQFARGSDDGGREKRRESS